jgi:hypothetical protein
VICPTSSQEAHQGRDDETFLPVENSGARVEPARVLSVVNVPCPARQELIVLSFRAPGVWTGCRITTMGMWGLSSLLKRNRLRGDNKWSAITRTCH